MEITFWRITKALYQYDAFSGEGARRYGARFNNPGRAVIYTSGSVSLAVLELLANLADYIPGLLSDYVILPATCEAALVDTLPRNDLPNDWRQFPHPASTRSIGDLWIEHGSSLVLAVPSAVVPREMNYLINPNHPDFSRLAIGAPEPLDTDPRIHA